MVRVLKVGTLVSSKVNGEWLFGIITKQHVGANPDDHRYDVKLAGRGRRKGSHMLVYQVKPSRHNWEEVPTK